MKVTIWNIAKMFTADAAIPHQLQLLPDAPGFHATVARAQPTSPPGSSGTPGSSVGMFPRSAAGSAPHCCRPHSGPQIFRHMSEMGAYQQTVGFIPGRKVILTLSVASPASLSFSSSSSA